MVEDFNQIETKPYLVGLNQLEVPSEKAEVPKAELDQMSEGLKLWNANFSLPIACLNAQENSYRLLTGLPIYQAAKNTGIQRIWVFLIAAKQGEAEKAIEQVILQSRLNQKIVVLDSQDITDFINFINIKDQKSMTEISGLGEKYAKQIIDKRPYHDLTDLQRKLGQKRPLNWAKAYKQIKK